ncbi:MAG: insulinase family protein [Pseudomonadales bacterium]
MTSRFMVSSFKRWIVWLLVVTVTTACGLIGGEKTDEEKFSSVIVKSENDYRDYQSVELSNKLRILLISDSTTDKAAASLDVHVGSAQDPDNYQGLAHFLEHMLFLGTKKFPEAGAYQTFISTHSGNHNAYTSFEHTNYFFDIDPAYLDQALDRFSQFFIAPLFTDEYVEREKNAVHSEYMAKIKTDQRKALDVFKSVINSRHPFAKFSVGNLDTLSVHDRREANDSGYLRDQLLSFYDEHYSASIMTLVVMGRESLPELEAIVRKRFSAIPTSDKQVESIDEPLFVKGSLPLMLQIQPEKEQRRLSIVFPTEEEVGFYRQKPLHYLGNLIGHEGKGSLLSYLKQKGWAEGLSAGTGLSYMGGATFNVTIKLTPKGVESVDDIIVAIFQAVNRISPGDDQRWLFEEQRALAEQKFRYQDMSTPIHYVLGLATDMHYYPLQDLLQGSTIMRQYDQQLIKRFLAYLTPANSFITLTAPEAKVDKQTHFYSTRYSVSPIDLQLLKRWVDGGLNPEITLPEANIYIAGDLNLKPSASTDSVDLPPELILEDNGLRLWFKHDEQFNLPKGSLLFSVRSPLASDSAEHKALLQMYTSMVSDQLTELSYPANLASLSYSLSSHGRGFSVKITGFNDKQDLLLDEILKALEFPRFDPQRFENLKQDKIRHLENAKKGQPYHRVMGQLPEMIYRYQWSEEQLLSVYKAMTLDQLKGFKQQLLARGEIDMLVFGNYVEQDAQHYAKKVSFSLLQNHAAPPPIEVVKLKEGILSRVIDSNYSDAALMLYFQGTDADKKRRAAMGLTAQILRADFYTKLRTEKQLGYIVIAGAYPIMEVPGIYFLVQSPVAGPSELKQEIENYLTQQITMAVDLDEKQFIRHREALVLLLSESPQNLWEQSEQYWQDIAQNYYQFDFKEQLIAAVKSVTLDEWRQYFTEDIVGRQSRAIWIYSVGQFTEQSTIGETPIESVPLFKSKQAYYHFP